MLRPTSFFVIVILTINALQAFDQIYVMTRGGPEPLGPDGELPADLDRPHYVEKVVKSIAESILCELGQSFDEVTGSPRQLTLL